MKSPLLASDKQQAAGSHKQVISQPPLRVDSSLLFLFCGQKSGEKGICTGQLDIIIIMNGKVI